MYRSLIPIFVLILLPTYASHYSYAQEESVYRLEVEGKTYDIPYKITNGKLVSMQADLDFLEIIIDIRPTGNGILDISLPRDLADRIANIGMLLVEVGGREIDYFESPQ